MPRIRDYTPATSILPTDAFPIDRVGVGTQYIQASAFGIPQIACPTLIINGAGSVIPTGVAGDLLIPFDCTIQAATLLSTQVGSVVIDIWAAPYASFPPTSANSICASDHPTLSSAQSFQDVTLTGWTKTLAANTTLRFSVTSVATLTELTIALTVQKTA